MAGPPLRVAWLGIAIAIPGCVNNYVVGDEGSTSVVAAEDTSSADMTAAATDIVDGGTVCSDPVCVGSTGTTVATMGDGNSAAEGDGASGGGGDTGLPAMGRAPCDPCETDLHCGGEFDLCVDLGGPSPVCTTRCFELPECSRGAACQAVISVEGQSADQCVPLAECPAAGTMDETDGM